MSIKKYYIYIMASDSGTLYTGLTSNLEKRVNEHKSDLVEGFTKDYGCHKLVYFKEFVNKNEEIDREKQIKK